MAEIWSKKHSALPTTKETKEEFKRRRKERKEEGEEKEEGQEGGEEERRDREEGSVSFCKIVIVIFVKESAQCLSVCPNLLMTLLLFSL